LTSNTVITEVHDHYTFNKEEGLLNDMSNKTEDGPSETFIENGGISELNQIEKNILGNSNKLSTQNQQTQTEKEQFSTEDDMDMDMDMFFQSLSLKAKQFPSNGRIKIKMKMSALMNELQEKYLVKSPLLLPQLMQPIYLNLFTNTQIPSEQNEFSSSSSIQSCTSTLPCLHSNSEFSISESSDDSNSSVL